MNPRAIRMPLLGMTLAVSACDADDGSARSKSNPQAPSTTQPTNTMKIKLTFKDKALTATLIDNPTTRDFISLLPLTVAMNDLFGREKFGHLPRAISDAGKRQFTYEIGQIIYWSSGPDVAIYYRDDGEKIPSPGIIVLAKVDSGIETLDLPGSVTMTIELVGMDEPKKRE